MQRINIRTISIIICFSGLIFSTYARDNTNNELGLSAAIQKTLENNYGIIISNSDADIAAINNHWGNAGGYPSVGFDLSSVNNYEISNRENALTNRLSGSIGLQWVLFDGFRVRSTKEQLSRLEDLALGNSAVVVESAIEDVIMAYYAVLLEQQRLKVLETAMKLSRDRYDYELARKELGGSVTYNVLQAQNVYLSDKAEFISQEAALRQAIRNLNFIMGEEPGMQWTLTESFAAPEKEYQTAVLLDKMESSNSVLKNQYINLMLQKSKLKISQSERYPTLSMSAGVDDTYIRVNPEKSDPSASGSFNTYGNLTLSYNLFTGGNRKRAIEVAQINREIAEIEIQQMTHNLTNQLFSVYDQYEVNKLLLEVARESLEAAELNMQIAEDKYRSGVINSFNYRDIQLIYINAALTKLRAIYNLIGTNTSLTRLTGGFITESAVE